MKRWSIERLWKGAFGEVVEAWGADARCFGYRARFRTGKTTKRILWEGPFRMLMEDAEADLENHPRTPTNGSRRAMGRDEAFVKAFGDRAGEASDLQMAISRIVVRATAEHGTDAWRGGMAYAHDILNRIERASPDSTVQSSTEAPDG